MTSLLEEISNTCTFEYIFLNKSHFSENKAALSLELLKLVLKI